mgnify:CR=1 FL=1
MPRVSRLVETRPTGHDRARGLVSSRVSGSRVEAHTYAPSDDLAGAVATFWMGRWDLRGQSPHVTELLGDPCVHIVFERGASRLVGVWTRRWVRELSGMGLVRAAKLRAGALRAFVPGPAARFTDRIVPLGEVLTLDASIEQTILDAADGEAFATLEGLLRSHHTSADPHVSLAVALVDEIGSDSSLATVDALARRSGLGVRALQRLFRDYVGASPKWAIRRVRLQELALRLERGEATNLAQVAADLGYTDQAHLTRDFTSAVGKSPRQFATAVHR